MKMPKTYKEKKSTIKYTNFGQSSGTILPSLLQICIQILQHEGLMLSSSHHPTQMETVFAAVRGRTSCIPAAGTQPISKEKSVLFQTIRLAMPRNEHWVAIDDPAYLQLHCKAGEANTSLKTASCEAGPGTTLTHSYESYIWSLLILLLLLFKLFIGILHT